MQQLNGLDSVMVLADMPEYPLHIGALFIYNPATAAEQQYSFDSVRQLLEQCINKSLPILKCRPLKLPFSLDNPYWATDKGFELDNHLQRTRLSQPADWQSLHTLTAAFHSEPLQPEQPLWQALFIEGLDHIEGLPSGCTGLLIKIHHAIADGKTAVKLFSALHTLTPDIDAPLIYSGSNRTDKFRAPNLLSQYTRAYWHAVSSPMKLTEELIKLGRTKLRSHSEKTTKQLETPRSVFNSIPGVDRHTAHVRIPITALQQLENKAGCTINDIALTIIGGAMRHYLLQQQQLPEQSLTAGMPIDSHDKGDDALGNQFSFARVALHTGIEDPVERLQAIHQATRQAKHSNREYGKHSLTNIMDSLYSGIIAWTAKQMVEHEVIERFPPVINTVATNVPGIQIPCYMAGAELVDYIGLGLLAPTLSLFHVISSLHSHINISCLTSAAGVSDIEAYHQALQQSAEEVLQAYDITPEV